MNCPKCADKPLEERLGPQGVRVALFQWIFASTRVPGLIGQEISFTVLALAAGVAGMLGLF